MINPISYSTINTAGKEKFYGGRLCYAAITGNSLPKDLKSVTLFPALAFPKIFLMESGLGEMGVDAKLAMHVEWLNVLFFGWGVSFSCTVDNVAGRSITAHFEPNNYTNSKFKLALFLMRLPYLNPLVFTFLGNVVDGEATQERLWKGMVFLNSLPFVDVWKVVWDHTHGQEFSVHYFERGIYRPYTFEQVKLLCSNPGSYSVRSCCFKSNSSPNKASDSAWWSTLVYKKPPSLTGDAGFAFNEYLKVQFKEFEKRCA